MALANPILTKTLAKCILKEFVMMEFSVRIFESLLQNLFLVYKDICHLSVFAKIKTQGILILVHRYSPWTFAEGICNEGVFPLSLWEWSPESLLNLTDTDAQSRVSFGRLEKKKHFKLGIFVLGHKSSPWWVFT